MRDRQSVSQLVDSDDVRDVTAAIAEPDDSARENQTQKQEAAGGDLAVAFAENEVSVSFVPFASRFEIGGCSLYQRLKVKSWNSHIKVRLAGFVG